MKLWDGERDRRSAWTIFLLPSKLIAADKNTHKSAVHGAGGPHLALAAVALTGTGTCLVTAGLKKTLLRKVVFLG